MSVRTLSHSHTHTHSTLTHTLTPTDCLIFATRTNRSSKHAHVTFCALLEARRREQRHSFACSLPHAPPALTLAHMDSIPSTSTTASSTSMDSQGSSSPTTTTTTTTTTTSNNKKPSLAQDTAWLQRVVSEFETAFVSKRFTAALQCCYAALKAISTPQVSSDRRETRASNGGDDDADLMAAFGPTGENSRQLARPRSACDSFRLQALRHPSCATEAIYVCVLDRRQHRDGDGRSYLLGWMD